jgi:hypothetical protein
MVTWIIWFPEGFTCLNSLTGSLWFSWLNFPEVSPFKGCHNFLDFLHQDNLLVAESKSQSSCKGDPCQIAKLWKPISTPLAHLNMGGSPRPLSLICGKGIMKDTNIEVLLMQKLEAYNTKCHFKMGYMTLTLSHMPIRWGWSFAWSGLPPPWGNVRQVEGRQMWGSTKKENEG